ncbi:MAG: class I SAM-dependent methyltransferase [Thermoanaerobaculales bacterium]|nr:class I SAM-dependent methyltransferase [Thermoanaerobaculales bacterium]
MSFSSLLAHSLTRGIGLDDPSTTRLRRTIIRDKVFLRRLYEEWYAGLQESLPDEPQPALEIGSGGGFMEEVIPNLVTSELFLGTPIHLVADGCRLPVADASLRGILAIDVLHHIPEPRLFLSEATRCLAPGGALAMIEPWVTPWSRIIYRNLHHEPFEPEAVKWSFPSTGPLSGANMALPWIIFRRDKDVFESEFPFLQIEKITPCVPFRYLVSGGISMRSLMPSFTFAAWRLLEKLFSSQNHRLGLFAEIVLRRV